MSSSRPFHVPLDILGPQGFGDITVWRRTNVWVEGCFGCLGPKASWKTTTYKIMLQRQNKSNHFIEISFFRNIATNVCFCYLFFEAPESEPFRKRTQTDRANAWDLLFGTKAHRVFRGARRQSVFIVHRSFTLQMGQTLGQFHLRFPDFSVVLCISSLRLLHSKESATNAFDPL